jgi:hypothetical protein
LHDLLGAQAGEYVMQEAVRQIGQPVGGIAVLNAVALARIHGDEDWIASSRPAAGY